MGDRRVVEMSHEDCSMTDWGEIYQAVRWATIYTTIDKARFRGQHDPSIAVDLLIGYRIKYAPDIGIRLLREAEENTQEISAVILIVLETILDF